MDTAMAGLMVAVLAGFLTLTAIESCCRPEPLLYEGPQEAAAQRGEGEYFTDSTGNTRFRLLGDDGQPIYDYE